MRRLLSILFLVAATLGAGSARQGGDLKSYVHELSPKVAKAYKANDSRFFDTLFSNDFKAKDEHGVLLGRKEALFVLRFQLNTIKVTDYKATTQAIKLEKARGTVTTTSKMMGLTRARRGQQGEKVEIVRRWSDLYEKRGNSWALVFRNELATPIVKLTPIAATKLVPATMPRMINAPRKLH